MITDINLAAAPTIHPLRWRHVLWLAILPVAFPLAVEAHDATGTHPAASSGTQLTREAPSTSLSGDAPGTSRSQGFYWNTPAARIPAVILWDESGNARRTGPGQSNTQSSSATIMASRR